MPYHKDRDEDYGKWRDTFHRRPPEDEYDYAGSPNPKRLYRSTTDRVIGGVCGGIADRFGWEPTLVRIAAVAAVLLGLGPFVIIGYLVMWMITPKPPRNSRQLSPDEDTFWRGVSDKPTVTFSNLRYKFMDLDDRLQRMEHAVVSDEWRLRKEFRDLERR